MTSQASSTSLACALAESNQIGCFDKLYEIEMALRLTGATKPMFASEYRGRETNSARRLMFSRTAGYRALREEIMNFRNATCTCRRFVCASSLILVMTWASGAAADAITIDKGEIFLDVDSGAFGVEALPTDGDLVIAVLLPEGSDASLRHWSTPYSECETVSDDVATIAGTPVGEAKGQKRKFTFQVGQLIPFRKHCFETKVTTYVPIAKAEKEHLARRLIEFGRDLKGKSLSTFDAKPLVMEVFMSEGVAVRPASGQPQDLAALLTTAVSTRGHRLHRQLQQLRDAAKAVDQTLTRFNEIMPAVNEAVRNESARIEALKTEQAQKIDSLKESIAGAAKKDPKPAMTSEAQALAVAEAAAGLLALKANRLAALLAGIETDYLAAEVGAAARAVEADLDRGAPLVGVLGLYSALRDSLEQQGKLSDGAAANVEAELKEELAIISTFAKTSEPRTMLGKASAFPLYVGIDVGVASAYHLITNNDGNRQPLEVFPTFGLNFYFAPVAKSVELKDMDFGEVITQRVSLSAGISLAEQKLANDLGVKGILLDRYVTLGVGFRLTEVIRVSGGILFFAQEATNPVRRDPTYGASPFFAASVDIDAVGVIVEAFKKATK